MSEPFREPLENVDAAWRHMEDPANLMMVTGIIVLEQPVQISDVHRVVESGLLFYDRFSQRVVDVGARKVPHWENVPELDWDYHLVPVRLPGIDAKREVNEQVDYWMSRGLDFNHPLWQIHLFENVGSGSVLMLRVHHAIADGMALVAVLLSMTASNVEESLHPGPRERPEHHLSSAGNLFRQAGKAIGTASKMTSKLVQGYVDALIHPSKILDLAKIGSEGAATAARMIFRQSDPATKFKGELGVAKRAVWSKPIPLDEVKRVRRVTGSTVNDVLLAAMSGALRRYLIDNGEQIDGRDIHAAVPVNLRDPRKRTKLGNEFGVVFLCLPIGIEDPLERIFEVRARMERIKKSPEAIISFAMLRAVGMTPVDIQRLIVNVFGAKTTAVMTNVPGPKEHLYLAGSRIESLMFWVPQSGRVGLGVSILSYAGQVRLGLATDRGLVNDPESIIEAFYAEWDTMKRLYEAVQE